MGGLLNRGEAGRRSEVRTLFVTSGLILIVSIDGAD